MKRKYYKYTNRYMEYLAELHDRDYLSDITLFRLKDFLHSGYWEWEPIKSKKSFDSYLKVKA